jgi:hypothetical protein
VLADVDLGERGRGGRGAEQAPHAGLGDPGQERVAVLGGRVVEDVR